MQSLRIIAGPVARQHLLREGLDQQQVSMMLGASGGPKWLSLFGLDQYLLNEFFAHRQTPLQLLGSSAGAWRFTCYAQRHGADAISRFARGYVAARFPPGMSAAEVSEASAQLLGTVLDGNDSVDDVLAHPVFRLNLVAARARALTASRRRLALMAGLGAAALANAISRRLLGLFFQRIVFHRDDPSPLGHLDDLPTQHVRLHGGNLHDAVFASGSIPLVLEAVDDIAGAGPGRYYDGGVTDYHFDLPLHGDGLVLYPHFYPHALPGWFDKGLPWRRARPAHYERTIIICPSDAWVASLPFAKIPDRKDFLRLDDGRREQYWRTVMTRSVELADEFRELVHGSRPWSAYLGT